MELNTFGGLPRTFCHIVSCVLALAPSLNLHGLFLKGEFKHIMLVKVLPLKSACCPASALYYEKSDRFTII